MELDDVLIEVRQIRADLQELKLEISRYKGFAGGVAWMVAGLAGMVGFLFSHLRGMVG